jgi:hypothetical protein
LLSPSTAQMVEELCATDLYTSRPPNISVLFSQAGPQFFTAWHLGLQAAQGVGPTAQPQFIPIATLEWDNRNLQWPAPGQQPAPATCASRENCAACLLVGAPGPLPVYEIPVSGGGAPVRMLHCLLCIREDVHAMVVMSRAKATTCGTGPCVQPPFQNLVGCPGGYDESVCSVRPGNQQMFLGGCHIVGASGKLHVRIDARTNAPFVDQSTLMFRSNAHADHFLG